MNIRIIILLILLTIGCKRKNEFSLIKLKSLVDNKNYELAKINLQDYIKTNKNDSEAFNLLGVCFFELNELKEAEIEFGNALEIEKNYKYYYNRGNVRIELNKLNLALKDFNKAITLNSDEGDIYNNRGNLFYRIKKKRTEETRWTTLP